MLWCEGYLSLKSEELSLNQLYAKAEGCQVQYQAVNCSPCSCTWGAASPLSCPCGQSLCKVGGELLPFFCPALFTRTLHSIIELSGNLGWYLFSEVLFALCLFHYNGKKSVGSSLVSFLYLQ